MNRNNRNKFSGSKNRAHTFGLLCRIAEKGKETETKRYRVGDPGNLAKVRFAFNRERTQSEKIGEKKTRSVDDFCLKAMGQNSGRGCFYRSSVITSLIKLPGFFPVFLAVLISFLITLPVLAVSDSSSLISPHFSGQQTASGQHSLEELDRVLKALEKFDHSQGEGPALELERLIFNLKDNQELKLAAEKKLCQFFAGPVTREAVIAVSKPLSWLAGSESVKALSPLIIDPEKSNPARYVLERVPGDEADMALIEALERAPADMMPGIISSLGHRCTEAAIPHLEKLLKKNPSSAVLKTTIEALGNIGGSAASKVLLDYLRSGDENIRLLAADALLRVANRTIEGRQFETASGIASSLLKSRLTPVEKLAAWKVKILAAGDNCEPEIKAALKSRDELACQAAIGLIPHLVSQDKIDSYLGLFSGLSENLQLKIAASLANYPVPSAREYLMNLASKSPWPEVRTEAIISLGKIGDSSTVEFLTAKAAASRGSEKGAARESLVALRGKEVDKKIQEMLSSSTDQDRRNELLLAACERNIRESREYFLKEAANPEADIALLTRGLRAFGDISLAEDLLNVAYKTDDEAFQEELSGIMALWARQSARPEARSAHFRNLLGAEKQPERRALLISIIGKIGERNSLPLLRNYLKSQEPKVREAAVRSLSDWPEAEARDDLMLIARSSSDLKERVLAIRGLVRLTTSERYRRPEAVVETLKEIYSLCPRTEEKKLVLSVFPDFPCQPGLVFCQSLTDDPEVGPEARTAAEKISQCLSR